MKLPLAHEIESFPPKVGEVEIEIKCLFDPTLKLQNALDLKRQQKDKQSLARERESRSKEDAVERLEKARRARAAIAQPEGSNDLDKLIEKSETLKRKMMASERNKEFPLETDVDQLLYDGVAGEGYADFPKLSKMKYKEAELESLRLATMHPQFEFGESNKSEQKGKATFNDIKKLFLEVFTVDFENQTLKDRLKGQNLSLQLKLPKFIGEKLQEDIFM
jgi:hypothetical protein